MFTNQMSTTKCLARLLLGALVVTLSACAQLQTQQTCTTNTLKGQYAFTGRGDIEPVDPGVLRMHYGIYVFDGSGTISGVQSSSRGGKIGRRETVSGTYTVDSDCTGTVTFGALLSTTAGGATHWDLFVTKDGQKGNMIRTDAGSMAIRNFEK